MSVLSDSARTRAGAWRGVSLVAITYVYFLIFAQFAFLKRLAQLGIEDNHLQAVMAAMAIGGIGFSLLSSHKALEAWPRIRLQVSLLICGVAAVCSLLPLDVMASMSVAFLIGSGLGSLTVTLVSNLQLWIPAGDGVFMVGVGTGIGYFLCNVPALFTASPRSQALTAACLCTVGLVAASKSLPATVPVLVSDFRKPPSAERRTSFPVVLAAFTALVWLDSAAFFIIQETPSLKAGTWDGTLHLWVNAFIHLTAALLSGYLIRRIGLRYVLAVAFLALSIACILLHQQGQAAVASLFYPAGVSLYSVALVAYPSFLAEASSPRQRAVRAGLIYAIAGWIGSAMGIGMAQHLRQVPIAFVVFAALLVLGPLFITAFRDHPRELLVVSGVLIAALCIRLLTARSSTSAAASMPASQRGRQVYIAEGCINCHSQYVRRDTSDVLMWGPAAPMEEVRSQHPPLIGNRRQGPDLSQVGGRRSVLWLKAHFFNPAEVSHASFMPSYSYLFENSTRGDDLVTYLSSLKSARYAEHVAMENTWQPGLESMINAAPEQGAHLYAQHCATCHDTNGPTRRTWSDHFIRVPPSLRRGPFLHVQGSGSSEERALSFARIIKFGIPGTDMPGHEYLSDQDVFSMALWLNQHDVPERLTSN